MAASENAPIREAYGSLREDPTPVGSRDTVANVEADPKNQQILYLWEEGNMPSVTEYTENNGRYADDPDFRPYVVTFPVPEGTPVKGVVLINAGGAFQYRRDQNEGTPVAEELSILSVSVTEEGRAPVSVIKTALGFNLVTVPLSGCCLS